MDSNKKGPVATGPANSHSQSIAIEPAEQAPEVFSTSRLLDCIGSKEEWQRQSGYSIEDSALATAHELIDNALDACEETDIPPVVSVTLDDTGLSVLDNGPGIAQETIEAMLDFSRRTSSRAGRCSTARGQQGNGGQACLALPFVLDGKIGRADIASHGILHEISVTVDRIAQKPVISDVRKDSLVKNGTFVKLWVPADMWVYDDEKKVEFLQVVENYGWFNPHLTLRIDCFGERREILATAPAWRKFRPAGGVPPQWYTRDSFERLATACIANDMASGKDRRLSEFVGKEFCGLKSTTKQRAVWEATGLARRHLSVLLNGDGLQSELTTQLYEELLKHGKKVKPEGLGIISREHVQAEMMQAGCDMDSFSYRKAADTDEGGLPFVVEMAFAEREAGPRMIRGVNFSSMIGNPFDDFYPSKCSISEHYSPVAFFVHVARPAIQSTDRGKAHVVLSETIQAAMNSLLEKVGWRWHRRVLANQRVNEAEDKREERLRQEKPLKQKREENRSLKQLIYSVLPTAIENYRATMGEIIWERQLYYNVRHDVLEIDDSKGAFSQQAFKGILNEWQKEHGDIEGLSNKPRGTFVEPHTGRRLPLGTRDVAEYVIPDYRYNKILIVEKQGFEELFDKHQIARKFDMGIVFNEGFSVDACKALVTYCRANGITVFVLHDTDPSGYVIYDHLRRDDDGIVDISFTMEQCLALGKTPETDYRRFEALPACILPHLSPKTLKVFKGKRVRTPPEVQKKWKKQYPYCWKYGRVELNDLATNPDEFIAEIEKRLKQHGAASKLVPPVSAIKQHAFEVRESGLHNAASLAIQEALDIDGMVASVVKKLRPKVNLKDIPEDVSKWSRLLLPESWENRIADIIVERIQELRDQLNELAERAIEDR